MSCVRGDGRDEVGRWGGSLPDDLSEEALHWGCSEPTELDVWDHLRVRIDGARPLGQPLEADWPYDPK